MNYDQQSVHIWNRSCQTSTITHRGVVKVIICNLLGYGLEAMETFDVPRGSVTNLDYRQASSNRVCNEDQTDKK